jgi:hypothetical protein
MNDFTQMGQKFDPQNGGIVEFGDDSRLFVEFQSRAVPDIVASTEAGRPISRQVDYIRIRQPGERDEIMRPAHDGDRRRFRRHWEAYQDGRQAMPDGTPLVLLFPNNPEIIENLKHDKIFVVEQLAALSDTQIQNIGMGARAWQQKAAELLMVSNDGKGFHVLQRQIDQQSAQIAALLEKNTALEAALTEATEKKRGKAA